MGDNENPKIVLDGDVSPFQRKVREAGEQLKKFASDGESAVSRMTGPLGKLQEKFVAIGALLAGGAVFKEAVQQTARFAEESTKLGRALGMSAGEASILREALEAGNTSQEEFVGAAKGLAKQLVENEDGLQAMGLKTRDAAGQLRPLNDLTLDAIGVLNGYRAGTDRAIAGQALFGKGFEMTSNLANMNKQAVSDVAEQMAALGMVVGAENIAAWQAFDDAGDKAGLTLKALKTTIGNALLPVLTKLSEWFAAIGPAAVVVIRGAIGGLVALFWGLKTAAGIAFELINASVIQLTEPIRAVSVAFWKLIHGDFEGAKAEIANIPKVWSRGWNTAFDTIVKDATEARDKMWNLFADGTPAAKPDGGGKSAAGLVKKDGPKKGKGPDSYMQYYEGALEEEKRLAYERDALRGYSKGEELAFWRALLANAELTGKDRLAIERKISGLVVDIRRAEAKQKMELDGEGLRSHESLALGKVEAERAAAQASLDLGLMTKAQFFAQEEQFERRRFEIQRAALLERMRLLELDPNTSPVEFARLKNQILELEQQYELKRIQMRGMAAQEGMGIFGDLADRMGGLWDKGMQAMLNGTLTWRNAIKAIGAEMAGWFAMEVVGGQVKAWIAGQTRMLAIKLGFMAQEKTAEAAGSAATITTKSAETAVVVSANAAEAASGAAASQAMIPIAGPALALAAMAAMFAAVSALGNRKSAMRGYDIPAGLNPLTQLHEEEMVLPQKYANVIRGLAQGGGPDGAGGSGGAVHVHTKGGDFIHKNDLAKLLKQLGRDFVLVR